jgi:hypothetical protein
MREDNPIRQLWRVNRACPEALDNSTAWSTLKKYPADVYILATTVEQRHRSFPAGI